MSGSKAAVRMPKGVTQASYWRAIQSPTCVTTVYSGTFEGPEFGIGDGQFTGDDPRAPGGNGEALIGVGIRFRS